MSGSCLFMSLSIMQLPCDDDTDRAERASQQPTYRSLGGFGGTLGTLGTVGPNIGAASTAPTRAAPAGTPSHLLVQPGLDVVVDGAGAARHFHYGTTNLLQVLAKLTHPVTGQHVPAPRALRFYRCTFAITGQQSEIKKDAPVQDVAWSGTATGDSFKAFDLTDKKPVNWLWCTVQTSPLAL